MGNPTDGGSALFDTIGRLFNIGFAAVGLGVLVLVFIVLLRGRPADEGTRRLHSRFLALGLSFAVLCGLLSVAAPLLASRPQAAPGRPSQMSLSFTPRFETQGLTSPGITLPDGRTVAPDTRFPAESGQLLVSADEALREVAQLREAAVTLAGTAAAAQRQADIALAAAVTARGPPSAPVAAAHQRAQEASQESQEAAAAITEAIRAGNYRILETKNRTLTDAMRASVTARSRALEAER